MSTNISINDIYTFLKNSGNALVKQEEEIINSIFSMADTENAEGKPLRKNKGDGFLNTKEWFVFLKKLEIYGQNLHKKLNDFITIQNNKINASKASYDINGNIEDFAQGRIGDCWLLAGLKALSSSEKGRQYIKEAIKDNGDGSYTITFKSYGDINNRNSDFSCVITKEELIKAREAGIYSSGDADVLLFELAMEKSLLEDVSNPEKWNKGQIIDGGGSRFLICALTGYIDPEFRGLSPEKLFEYKYNDFKNGEITFTFTTSEEGSVKDIKGNDVTIVNGHEYSIVDIHVDKKDPSKNTVTIVNPWDSEEEIVLPMEEFSKINSTISSFCDVDSIKIDDIFAPYINGDIDADSLYGTLFNLASFEAFSEEEKEEIIKKADDLGLNIEDIKSVLYVEKIEPF